MPSNGGRIDSIELGNELIGSCRELELGDLGVVVTHRISGRSQSPVQFQLFDPLPGGFHIDDIGFHPNYLPEHGRVDREAVVISGVVEPEQILEIKYGICSSHPEQSEVIQRIQSNRRPSIEISTIVGPTDDVSEALEKAATMRSASEKQAADESGGLSELSHRLWSGDAEPDTSGASSTESSAAAGSETNEDAERSKEDEHWIKTLFGEDDDEDLTASGKDESTDRSDEEGMESEYGGMGGDPFGDSPADGALSSNISRAMAHSTDMTRDRRVPEPVRQEDEEYQTIEAIFSGIDEQAAEPTSATKATDTDEKLFEKGEEKVDTTTGPDTFAAALLSQFEAGAVSDDQGRRLARQLAECGVSALSVPTEKRLRSVESEMVQLGKHIDIMETVIDQHGTADRYLSGVREEISELEGSIRALESDLEAAADDRKWTADQLDEVEDLIDDMEARTSRLEAWIDSFRTAQRSTFAELEAQLTDIDPVVDRVDQIDAELRRLRDTVESGRRVQHSILRALSDEGSGDT